MRFVAGPGRRGRAAGRECHGEEDGGTVADSHREAFAGQGAAAEHHREAATAGKEGRATAGKGRYCWKGEPLLEIRTTAGKENHCWKGKECHCRQEGIAAEQRVGLFFLMRPLCKLFLYL